MRFLRTLPGLILTILVSSLAVTSPALAQRSAPIAGWTPGLGQIRVLPFGAQGGFRLQTPPRADYGNAWVEVAGDVDAAPILTLFVAGLSPGAKWSISVNDPEAHALKEGSEGIGSWSFDLRRSPNWHGNHHFRIYITLLGGEQNLDIASVTLGGEASPSSLLLSWNRDNGARVTAAPTGEIHVTNGWGKDDNWGGVSCDFTADTDRLPFVEVDLRRLSPGARWRIECAGQATGPEERATGRFAFNFREAAHKKGVTTQPIRIVLLGIEAQAEITSIRLVAAPTDSAELVRRASRYAAASPHTSPSDLTTGSYRVCCDDGPGVLRIGRSDTTACLVTRLYESAGVDMTPPGAATWKADGPNRRTLSTHFGEIDYDATVEAFPDTPGLLHWRVRATARTDTLSLASAGQEIAYVGPSPLRPLASQNLSATALAQALAPGVGTVLYVQNLIALNDLFDLSKAAPRFRTSVGTVTLGTQIPLSTSATLPVGKSITLSDAYLFLTPGDATDGMSDEDRQVSDAYTFLRELSAVYDHLPDKPETSFHDWPGLANAALRDLHRGDCWGSFNGKEYLQPYLGTPGVVAQIDGLQEVLAPLLRFQKQTGEGADIVGKLEATLPTFWYEGTGTFREYALPGGNHTWYDAAPHCALARAAILSGDATTKDLCLRSADALIRLAHETNYSFERKDAMTIPNQQVGPYLLYMMLCHELAPGDSRFLPEARHAADQLRRFADAASTRETFWTAMACEGLGRLYRATGDKRYVRLAFLPLAAMMKNVWLWECRYGVMKDGGYTVFWGINADASGIDYIAAMEQHQCWAALRQFYLDTREALPPPAQTLVSEFVRYAPQTVWYAYPPNLPTKVSLFRGTTFWHTRNDYGAFIPFEDLSDGWRRNGSVGQEIYGAGAAFNVASQAYMPVLQAGLTVFSESPVLSATWDAKARSLTVKVGGLSRYPTKIEVRRLPHLGGDTAPPVWPNLAAVGATYRPATSASPLSKAASVRAEEDSVLLSVPGDSIVVFTPGKSGG